MSTQSYSNSNQFYDEVEERLKSADTVSLISDFDGTLVPIADDPDVPSLDLDTAETLKLLSGLDSVVLTVMSGRAVEDLHKRIRLRHIIYAGNHGREIFGRDLCYIDPPSVEHRADLERLCEELSSELHDIRGASVEYKGLTASLHFRKVAQNDLHFVASAVHRATERWSPQFTFSRGKMVFDIVPETNWNKGAAAQWINSQIDGTDILTIYLGDDTSDEEAFRLLPDDITIRVGYTWGSRARYQLPDQKAVLDFLRWLAQRVAVPQRRV
jgi:trehalose-phosphatase